MQRVAYLSYDCGNRSRHRDIMVVTWNLVRSSQSLVNASRSRTNPHRLVGPPQKQGTPKQQAAATGTIVLAVQQLVFLQQSRIQNFKLRVVYVRDIGHSAIALAHHLSYQHPSTSQQPKTRRQPDKREPGPILPSRRRSSSKCSVLSSCSSSWRPRCIWRHRAPGVALRSLWGFLGCWDSGAWLWTTQE